MFTYKNMLCNTSKSKQLILEDYFIGTDTLGRVVGFELLPHQMSMSLQTEGVTALLPRAKDCVPRESQIRQTRLYF